MTIHINYYYYSRIFKIPELYTLDIVIMQPDLLKAAITAYSKNLNYILKWFPNYLFVIIKFKADRFDRTATINNHVHTNQPDITQSYIEYYRRAQSYRDAVFYHHIEPLNPTEMYDTAESYGTLDSDDTTEPNQTVHQVATQQDKVPVVNKIGVPKYKPNYEPVSDDESESESEKESQYETETEEQCYSIQDSDEEADSTVQMQNISNETSSESHSNYQQFEENFPHPDHDYLK